MAVRKWPVVGVVLAVLWLFVRGVSPDVESVVGGSLVGLALGLPVAFLLRRLYAPETNLVRNVRAAPYAVLYVVAFVWELVTANLDVAYRTLSPSMPIEPDVIVVPLRVETAPAVTTIANSITLTPGTLTMDHDPEHNVLFVHAIDGRDPEAVVAPIRRWEDYALVIFDEDSQPGDPAPTWPPADEGDATHRQADGEVARDE
ncbi:MAG: Na+/H+ antiporter subunit E [Halobacteriaceae archaeon]